jgi:chromosome segregation ATPase
LTNRIKQLEDALSRKSDECLQLGVQIADKNRAIDELNTRLSLKMAEHDTHFGDVQREIDRLNFDIHSKDNEIETWKNRYNDLDKSSKARIEDILKKMEK